MKSTNALAELAERLKYYCKPLPRTAFDFDIETTQRIVAELAKVEPGRILGGRFDVNSLLNLETMYENCRLIAEEGLGDGLGTR